MTAPLVSVVIPAYNASDYISETISSVLCQTFPNIEIIVVDDGSTDDTEAIIGSFGEKIKYIYQKNSGSCASPRNTGLAHAQGVYVTFFDADDIMLPNKIEEQVNDLEKFPDAVMSISNYWNFSGPNRSPAHFTSCDLLSVKIAIYDGQPFVIDSEDCRKILLEENFSIASSPLFRKSIVTKIEGFNETLKACEDFHLIYRVAIHGAAVINSRTGFLRRLHDNNMSSDNERMLRNLAKSRSSLHQIEPSNLLKNRLCSRVQGYKRSLLSTLIDKGDTTSAVQIFFEVMPPHNLKEFVYDCKQLVRFALVKLNF